MMSKDHKTEELGTPKNSSSPIIVTGAAGFIGFHVSRRLANAGFKVIAIDCFTPYYALELKEARWAELAKIKALQLERIDIADASAIAKLFADHKPERVIHLAAQPGVRRALVEPQPYIDANITAFLNILEACRHNNIQHLVYASSSSVYGANRKFPFSEHDNVDHPVSLYAATKKANEAMAHAYSHLFGFAATGLRFFTVYGPWGRPDMAVYAFTDAIANGREISVSNAGKVWRDFTYIDDIVEGITRVLDKPTAPNPDWDATNPDPATGAAPHRIYNIGNDNPEELNDLIGLIERALNRKAIRKDVPLPPGDVLETRADISDLRNAVGFAPSTSLEKGVEQFVSWYRSYHTL
ncbi:NAD-dependent epimerase/dehydratase family protein [Microvirga sp. W0021]|uniref:NAD-dependent epimerase/dehydratase family protein n=1 Tax=Hohaiivirga grylli TaxID=3133970 RepID=A0ABV0BH95_9HYPH